MWLAGMKGALKKDYKQMPGSISCSWAITARNGLQGKFTEVSHLDWDAIEWESQCHGREGG